MSITSCTKGLSLSTSERKEEFEPEASESGPVLIEEEFEPWPSELGLVLVEEEFETWPSESEPVLLEKLGFYAVNWSVVLEVASDILS